MDTYSIVTTYLDTIGRNSDQFLNTSYYTKHLTIMKFMGFISHGVAIRVGK